MKGFISFATGLVIVTFCLNGIYLNIQANKIDGIVFFIVILLFFLMFWIPLTYYKYKYPDDE